MATTNIRGAGKGDNVLTSQWMGLNEFLIANIFPVDSEGIRKDLTSKEVHAPFIDANIEIAFNWQSPFENSSADQKAPALVAMLQSGAIIPFLRDIGVISSDVSKEGIGKIESGINAFKGRTGITRLNSTQIFTGMPPVKITGSLLFRAYSDPLKEVEEPFRQLMEWVLPQELSSNSLAARVKDSATGSLNEGLLPSMAPLMLGLQYKQRYYAPLVVESIGEPLSSPISSNGYYTEIVVPITFCSLTALDKNDMARIMRKQKATK